MKKEYIQPQTEKIPFIPESNLLNNSFIGVGGGTDKFEAPRKNEYGFNDIWEEYPKRKD